jgi:hypothetical protein
MHLVTQWIKMSKVRPTIVKATFAMLKNQSKDYALDSQGDIYTNFPKKFHTFLKLVRVLNS